MKLSASVEVFAMGFRILYFETKKTSQKEIFSVLKEKIIQPGTYEVKVRVWIIKAINFCTTFNWKFKVDITPKHHQTTITFK